MKNIYILSICIFLLSCSHHEEELAEINKWENTVDSVEKIFYNIDTVIVDGNLNTMQQYINTITNQFADDLTKETSMLLSDYKQVEKTVRRFNRAYEKGKTEITYTKKQLKSLKAALKSGSIKSEEKVTQYMNEEREAVNQLKDFSGDIQRWVNSSNEQFHKIHPVLKQFVDSLAEKKANSNK